MKRRDFVTRIVVAGSALSMGVGCGRKIEGEQQEKTKGGNKNKRVPRYTKYGAGNFHVFGGQGLNKTSPGNYKGQYQGHDIIKTVQYCPAPF